MTGKEFAEKYAGQSIRTIEGHKVSDNFHNPISFGGVNVGTCVGYGREGTITNLVVVATPRGNRIEEIDRYYFDYRAPYYSQITFMSPHLPSDYLFLAPSDIEPVKLIPSLSYRPKRTICAVCHNPRIHYGKLKLCSNYKCKSRQ